MQPYNLKYYTDGLHGYTPTSFALAQIVHNTASLIDEWIDHNEVTEWSERYGDAYSNWREEIK